jgi:hypothetical protein
VKRQTGTGVLKDSLESVGRTDAGQTGTGVLKDSLESVGRTDEQN